MRCRAERDLGVARGGRRDGSVRRAPVICVGSRLMEGARGGCGVRRLAGVGVDPRRRGGRDVGGRASLLHRPCPVWRQRAGQARHKSGLLFGRAMHETGAQPPTPPSSRFSMWVCGLGGRGWVWTTRRRRGLVGESPMTLPSAGWAAVYSAAGADRAQNCAARTWRRGKRSLSRRPLRRG